MGEIKFIDMATISLVPTLISLRDIFDTVKFLYENREKKKELETQKKKRLIVNVFPRLISIGWDPHPTDTNSFTIEIDNPKNYPVQIQKFKLMEVDELRKVERDVHQLPENILINKGGKSEPIPNIFKSLVSDKKGRKWIIRVIDSDGDWHDSRVIDDFTSH